MKKSISGIFCVLVGIGMFYWCSTAAFAQESDPDSFMLEEITVTAEKRETNLQKTAISMAVIEGETIRDTGVVSMHDVLKDIPNVSTSDTGDKGATINIRGLGNDMPIGVGDSSVSINYDGAYQMRSEAGMFGFFDVDRVEVLRGPQGTLYGRNATGGVVNVISVKPTTDRVEGYASLEGGNYRKRKAEAAVNVPMSDTVASRLAFVSTRQEGYTHDSEGGVEGQEGLAGRLQLGYTPREDVSINLQYNFTERSGRMVSEVAKPDWVAGNYDLNNHEFPYNRTFRSNYRSSKISLTADFPLGVGMVTVLPTYEKIKNRTSIYDIGRGETEPSLSEGGMPWNNETTTGELRYASRPGSNVTWVGGLYYSKTDEPQVPRSVSGNNTELDDAWKKYKSQAAFAQATYPFTDTFRGVFGARYSKDDKGYYDETFGISTDGSPTYPVKKNFEFSYFDWKLGVEKDFGTDIMAYLTVATGHKAGGFSENTGKPFDTEKAISGEVGVKSRLMANRLQLNGDVFYYKYKNYQVVDASWVVNDDYPEGTVMANFFNADESRSYGAEIESTALIGSATVLTLNFAYLKNEYVSDFYMHADPFSPAINMKGMPMPHSPEFTVKGGISHSFLFADGSTLKPSLNARWTDSQYYGTLISDDTHGPAYTIVDVYLTYNTTRNWSLNIYANNALDEHYYSGSVQQATMVYFAGSPRTTGVTLNVKF